MRCKHYLTIFFLSVLLFNMPTLYAQQTDEETCRKSKREAGIQSQRQGQYANAIKYFKAIRLCYPQSKAPQNVENDINSKIKECNDAIVLAQKQKQDAAEKERLRQSALAQEQKQSQTLVANVDIQMVFVRGGTFTMGCTSEQGSDCDSDEKPTHKVTVSDFYIGKYEVTQAQWKAVMGSNPSYYKGDNLPVENVSWNDVQEFIRKLNAKTGENYRLPTEAEWEYAARGGASSRGYKYSGSNNVGEVAWYGDNSGSKTHTVGQKRANELGIYDMSGNVWEWCRDWYGSYSSSAQQNPTGAYSGSYRVARGGSWDYYAQSVRVPNRGINTPGDRSRGIGFRLVRSSK
jgi:formylglycine-generating enzyme required for sulfatase activity